ncbi:VCBS repeat-containing protein [Stigmatella sp. ncwal1]|uniref:VCBS repeat-containing protein n=1 Tax=Stigmatella ashevillensis TaxID=2995309 RepID=A0ABT5DDD7_9BACT|nr:VCBS repeat-containing protein [Stigmatella ashevillena]MDC0711700.1 VCBS repeat-containing protein [Stigmatella ashevillena]
MPRLAQRSRGLRLAVLAVALTVSLPGVASAATVSFCAPVTPTAGVPFSNQGSYSGALAAANYKMTVTQSGPFTIQNLQATWNNIVAGAFQTITGPGPVTFSGIVPASASPGQTVTVTFRISNILGQIVDTSTATVTVNGPNNGWTKVWTASSHSAIADYSKHYVGDFDGDGTEDILGVSSTWMTMFHYINNDWVWGWSNYGDSAAGNGIYPYRDKLIVGDFDGDGKDEVLGGTPWLTMFHFDNGNWNWGWSNYGNAQDALYPYAQQSNYLLSGNFDIAGNSGSSPVNKDEIVGVGQNGWITLFRLNANGSGWDWVWSTGPDVTSHALYPYRSRLSNGGDTNGDGQDELLGRGGWATTFSFANNNFNWAWSTYGANSIAGVGYPQRTSDVLLVGNIDYTDARDEWFFIQNGSVADWATTVDWGGSQFTWNWSNHNYTPAKPFIGDWPLANSDGSNARYQLIRAVAGKPKFLFARRQGCDMRMYEVSSTVTNY